MLEVDQLKKSFANDIILEDVSLSVKPKERVALVGRNGTGKSTLLKIIAGSLEADSGRVSVPRGWRIAYLPQDGVVASDRPLHEEALSVFADVLALEARQRALEAKMRRMPADSPELVRLIEEHHALQTDFERLDGFTVEAKVGTVLAGLGFPHDEYDRPVSEYSGGWQMRVALAKLLLQEADLLLLDEPTNHLDLAAVEWLEEYVQRYRGSVVVVSHDRYFLDRATTRTLELENGRVTSYPGRYSWYVEERARRMAAQQGAYERQREYIAEQTAYIEKFRYNAKRSSLVKSREKMLDKLERIEAPREGPELAFRLPTAPPSGDEVVALRGVDKAYGDNPVLQGVDVLVRRSEKLALVGPNGSGKSTLLRLLARVERPDGGFVVYGPAVQIAYFAQNSAETLNPRNSVLEEVYGAAPRGTILFQIRSLLGRFLFRQDEVFKSVSALSGGERSRVALAKMLLRPANLLLLDEPTNHLDVAAKEVIEDALREYPGTVVVASHDRYFLERFVTRTLEVRDGGLGEYLGNYTYYRERKEAERAAAQARAEVAERGEAIPPVGRAADKAERVAEANDRKARAALRKELQDVEGEVSRLEERIAELADLLGRADAYTGGQSPAELVAEYERSTVRLEALNRRWEELVEAM